MKPARSKQLRKTPCGSKSGQMKEEPVEVYCRIKPIQNSFSSCLKVVSPTTVQLSPPEGSMRGGSTIKEIQYTFRQVFDENVSQKEIFDTVALPLVTHLVQGRNGLLFTYGVTGSGKTYTMNGDSHDGGIMPRCIDVIFNTISNFQAKKFIFKSDKMNGFEIQDEAEAMLCCQNDLGFFSQVAKTMPKTPKRKEGIGEGDVAQNRTPDFTKIEAIDEENMFAVFVNYIEIYNNNVHDLLSDCVEDIITRKLQNKVIREDASRNMYVHGVTEVEVKCPEEAFEVFYKGQKRKRMAHTNLNEESSRSHSIFTIRLVQAPTEALDEQLMMKKFLTISQLSLVDLAGSERTNRTKNTGQRLREAGNINNSLMSLRTCLEILRENQQNGTNKMVPYRDSKLTHLFKNYFDGEGQVRMIVCVNPRAEDYDENVHVLKFAEMTQEVQVPRPVVSKQDICITPGRKRFNQYIKKTLEEINTNVELNSLNEGFIFDKVSAFPSLILKGPDDEETLENLKIYLQQRLETRNAAMEKFNTLYQTLREGFVKKEGEYIILKQENIGMKGALDQERKKVANMESQIGYSQKERSEALKKIEERDAIIRELQQKVEDQNMLISQKTLDKEKVKEKCVTKIAAAREKIAREMHMKLNKERDEFENKIKDHQEKFRMIREFLEATPKVASRAATSKAENVCPTTPLSVVNTQGTLYMPHNATPSHHGHTQKRGVAVSNPRHRRSRSIGCSSEVWLDHKPVNAIELNTVFQPSMKKRKSVTKLTDVKHIVNSKTSKYCLTTQEQDTDGELETKLYKGDVIPTTGGGAQVILNDVELLKQISPTSEVTSRKRSLVEGSNNATESRCAISIEGHSKRTKT